MVCIPLIVICVLLNINVRIDYVQIIAWVLEMLVLRKADPECRIIIELAHRKSLVSTTNS